MKEINFIYSTFIEYFQTKITFDKSEVTVKKVYFDLENCNLIEKTKRKIKINQEIRQTISKNDVIVATSDFNDLSIITKGGIIIADSLSEASRNMATKKRDKRRNELDLFFVDDAYSENHFSLYEKNKEIIKKLLELQKEYLESKSGTITIDEYKKLLKCLIEITEPIKSSDFEENLKQLTKEYSTN